MREVTKSITSFSWAISLFGIRQMTSILQPSKAVAALDSVTLATERQLDDSFRSAFELGDRMQRRLVDFSFNVLTMGAADSSRWARATAAAFERGAAAIGAAMTRGNGGSPAESGWGPMPPRQPGPTAGTESCASGKAGGWGPVTPASG